MPPIRRNGQLLRPSEVVNSIDTIDKDLLTVPGWIFNPDKYDFPIRVTREEADRRFHLQWMMGDSGDGYKGMKGIGIKTAEKWLDEGLIRNEDPVVTVLEQYRAHKEGYTWTYVNQMARCARILRAEDWDRERKRPRLWEPTPSQWAQAGWTKNAG